MMKKILSVVLSMTMLLSLFAGIPVYAEDPVAGAPAAVEYTVSNVTYQEKSAADGAGQPTNKVPAEGKWLAPSVSVSATAAADVTVVFAVYADNVLQNAYFQTQTVSATPVTFTKPIEITSELSAKGTFAVYVLDKKAKAIAPASNFPVHENKLAYVTVYYMDLDENADEYVVESETIYATDDSDVLSVAWSAARDKRSPKIVATPVDNSSTVAVDVAQRFWADGAKVTLTALDGTTKAYAIKPAVTSIKYTPSVNDIYAFENTGNGASKKSYPKQTVIMTDTTIDIDVPAGTEKVTLDSFTIGTVKVSASTLSFTNQAAQKKVTVDGVEYIINFRWDANTPYIYNVSNAGLAAPKRSFILRANGLALKAQHSTQTEVATGTAFSLTTGAAIAGASANTNVAINGTPIPNDKNLLTIATTNAEIGIRANDSDSVDRITGSFVKGNETDVWYTFTPSHDGVLYVRATQADAMRDDYYWDEITNMDGSLKDGWTLVENATLSGTPIKLFAKNFTAGEAVSIPTQAYDRVEHDYVTAALKAKGYTMESYSAGTLPVFNGKSSTRYYRASSMHSSGVLSGYDALFLICFDNEYEGDDVVVNQAAANKLDLAYSTALAVTAPKASVAANAANGTSLHAAGMYQPTLVENAMAVIDHSAKTFTITVPYGTEVVNLQAADYNGKAVDAPAVNLINKNGVAEASILVGETTYTGTISWVGADDSANGLTAGNTVYDVQYRVKDLANTDYYNIVPSKLKLAQKRVAKGTVALYGNIYAAYSGTPVAAEAGTWVLASAVTGQNSNVLVHNAGASAEIGRIETGAFANWVKSGFVTANAVPGAVDEADVDTDAKVDAIAYAAMNNATTLVTNYNDIKTAGSKSGANANIGVLMSFKVAQDSVLYVDGANYNPGAGWTKYEGAGYLDMMDVSSASTFFKTANEFDTVEAVTNIAHHLGGSDAYYRFARKGEVITLASETEANANFMPVVFIREVTAPTLDKLYYTVGDGEAVEIVGDTVELAYTAETITLGGTVTGSGQVVGESIQLTYAGEDVSTGTMTAKLQNVYGDVLATYPITFTMDFTNIADPVLDTLTYTVGDGEAEAIEIAEGEFAATVPVAYSTEEIAVQASIAGDGTVTISDAIALDFANQTGDITVVIKNARNEEVATYTITFEMDFVNVTDPELATLEYVVNGGAAAAVELEGNTASVVVPEADSTIEVAATITGNGKVTVSDPIELSIDKTSDTITVTIENVRGDVVATYEIEFAWPAVAALASATVTSTLNNAYAFATINSAGTKYVKNTDGGTKTITFAEVEGRSYVVTVPYGTGVATATITNERGETAEVTADFGVFVKEETSGNGKGIVYRVNRDTVTEEVAVAGSNYKVTFKWDDALPYIYNYDDTGYSYYARNIVLRGDGVTPLYASVDMGNTLITNSADVAGNTNSKFADANAAETSIEINGRKLANNGYLSVFAINYADNYYRGTQDQHTSSFYKIAHKETASWTKFTPSANGTVYVTVNHANAGEEGFEWKEGKDAGWTKVENAKFQGRDTVVYSKRVTAGVEVSVPSQVMTQDEIDYINTKIAAKDAAKGDGYQYKYVLTDDVEVHGAAKNTTHAILHYSTDGGATWTNALTGNTAKRKGTINGVANVYVDYLRGHGSGIATRIGEYGSRYFFLVVEFDQPNAPEEEPVAPELATLTYSVDGAAAQAITFAGDATTAAIEVAHDAAAVAVEATITGEGTVEATPATITESGNVVVTVKDSEGAVVKTYTITFTWADAPEQPPEEEPVAPELATLTYSVDGAEAQAITFEGDATTAAIEVAHDAAAVAVAATITGEGTVEATPATITESGNVVVTVKDSEGAVVKTYTITFTWAEAPVVEAPALTSALVASTLNDSYAYRTSDGTGANSTAKRYIHVNKDGGSKTVTFEEGTESYVVTVPYGTGAATATLTNAEGATADVAVSFQGEAVKVKDDYYYSYLEKDTVTETITIGGFEYDVTFKWDNTLPYVYDLDDSAYTYKYRNIILRADGVNQVFASTGIGNQGAGGYAYTEGSNGSLVAAVGAENTNIVINGQVIANDGYLTIVAPNYADSFYRGHQTEYSDDFHKAAHVETAAWTSFVASNDATVYVTATHANAGEEGFEWKEGKAAGWEKVESATFNGGTVYVYSKTFAAGETISVPSQVITASEIEYVNDKLAAKDTAANDGYNYRYVLTDMAGAFASYEGAHAVLQYSTDGGENWNNVVTAAKTRQAEVNGGIIYGDYLRGQNIAENGQDSNTKAAINQRMGTPYGRSNFFLAVVFENPNADEEEPVAPELATLTYSVDGAEAQAITFEGDATTAAIEVAYDAAAVAVEATITGEGTVEATPATITESGNVVVTVKDSEGAVVKTYTITFTWAEAPEGGEDEEEPADPSALNDLEDLGMVAAVVADSLNAEQDPTNSDVTVSGEATPYEHVAIFVLADGATIQTLRAAIAGDEGDLAGTVILSVAQTMANAEGDFEAELTLPADSATAEYNVAVLAEDEATEILDYIGLVEKIAVYTAVVEAAQAGSAEAMTAAFADIDLIIAQAAAYDALENKTAVRKSIMNMTAVKALPEISGPSDANYSKVAELAAYIDARIAAQVLNEGATADEFEAVWDAILPEADANSDVLAAVAGAIYAGDALKPVGKENVLKAITGKNFDTATSALGNQIPVTTVIRNAFAEAAFVQLINNTAYTSVNNVLPLVQKYRAAGVFASDMKPVNATNLAAILKNKTIKSYKDFESLIGKTSDAPAGGNDAPAAGGGATSGSMSNVTTEPEVVVPEDTKVLLASFTDADDAAWAATALQLMLDRKILNGYEDNTIRPNNHATRQEVAKMLVSALSEVRAGAWTGFSDVPAGSWYYSYVATAAEDGIINGIGDGMFGTDAKITREDLSVLIYRFLVNKGIAMDATAKRTFTDAATISDYAVDAVNALTNAGVVNGYTDGSFGAKGNATRAEIAQVIANVIVLFAL